MMLLTRDADYSITGLTGMFIARQLVINNQQADRHVDYNPEIKKHLHLKAGFFLQQNLNF